MSSYIWYYSVSVAGVEPASRVSKTRRLPLFPHTVTGFIVEPETLLCKLGTGCFSRPALLYLVLAEDEGFEPSHAYEVVYGLANRCRNHLTNLP